VLILGALHRCQDASNHLQVARPSLPAVIERPSVDDSSRMDPIVSRIWQSTHPLCSVAELGSQLGQPKTTLGHLQNSDMTSITPADNQAMNTQTITIFGATGNLGALTASALTAEYPDVRLRLVSSRPAALETLHKRFPIAELVIADWYDRSSLENALVGADRLFMVTPDFVTDECIATSNIIEAARTTGTIRQLLRLIAIPPGLTTGSLSREVLDTRCGAALHLIAKPLLDASDLPVTYINVPCWIMFNIPWFLAEEVKVHRRLTMPACSDSPRLWIAENDIADVAAKLLTDTATEHIGREYQLTGSKRYTFRDVAMLLSETLGERVEYVDDAAALRRAMGNHFEKLMTYFGHETRDYANVQPTDTVSTLLGRPQLTLPQYLAANKALFA
jgi:NAD(P)H dehydrogenase (quinone)